MLCYATSIIFLTSSHRVLYPLAAGSGSHVLGGIGGARSGTEVARVALCGELNANECSENAGGFLLLVITGISELR